jgi:hypothetical protein
MWTCKNCAEEVEDQFDACWDCEANRQGRLPSKNSSGEDTEDTRTRALLREKHRPKQCQRCNVTLRWRGTKESTKARDSERLATSPNYL